MSNSATESGQESGGSNGTTGQESGAGGGQGQASGDQGNGTGNGGNGSGDQFDLSTIQDPALRTYLEKVDKDAREARAEAARYRTERNNLQSQFQQFRSERETEAERAERERQEREQSGQAERERLAALERENRDLKVGGVLRDAAVTAKAINPATVVGLLKDKVTLDDQGQPTNLQDLLKGLRESDPYLFKRASSDAGRGQGNGEGSATTTDMNDLIRSKFRP